MSTKGDPFRRDYGTLTEEQKEDMKTLKILYETAWDCLIMFETKYGRSRDLAVAKTELQTSCMWAIRAATKTGDQE